MYLLDKHNIKMDIYINTKFNINVCFIGSLIGWSNLNYEPLYILGSGIRTENDYINKKNKMKIYSVRGPMTKEHLEKYNFIVPEIFGDPALLLPQFYSPQTVELCKNKIGIIGHLTNFHKYNNLPDEYILINPTWNWEKVISYITSCKLILSSSLHGLIMADAYKIPNIWLNEYKLNEGEFKFKDYFKSQNREIEYIDTIYKYKDVVPYDKGNIINLSKINDAFITMINDLSNM